MDSQEQGTSARKGCKLGRLDGVSPANSYYKAGQKTVKSKKERGVTVLTTLPRG